MRRHGDIMNAVGLHRTLVSAFIRPRWRLVATTVAGIMREEIAGLIIIMRPGMATKGIMEATGIAGSNFNRNKKWFSAR
jgi:hypothetical protein